MLSKHKHNSCSLEDKLEVIEGLDKHESGTKLLQFGVGKATISDWKKNHATIEQFCAKTSADTVETQQNCNVLAFGKIGEALYLWNISLFMFHTRRGKRNSLKWTTHTRKG